MDAPALRWAAFAGLTVGLFLVLRVVLGIARKRQVERAARTGRALDAYLARLLEHTGPPILVAVAAFAAIRIIDLTPMTTAGAGRGDAAHAVRILALLALFFQFGRWGTGLIDMALDRGFRYARFSETASRTAFGVVRFFAMAALWTSVAILVLGTLGVAVTPLLAGLGVGGIAVGFALQRILGDVFCSVAIVLDRPFEVGDLIQAGDYTGTVERIGVKSTRARGVGGEQIVFPNSDLIQSRIRNFSRMTERRIAFRFAVPRSTPAATLGRIPGLVETIFAGLPGTRFDRAHFAAFGDSTFSFEVTYFVLDPDPDLAAEIQGRINLALARILEELGAPP